MPSKSVEDKILPRRFDLIRKIYFSNRVVAANKKDIMFNWLLEQFGSYKNDQSAYVYQLLWEIFHEILVAEKENKCSYRVLIKSNAIINLLDAVTNYPYTNPCAYVILSTITAFLQTPTVNASLIADVDLMLKLLAASINIICKIHLSDSKDALSLKKAKILANVILDILENLPSSDDEGRIPVLISSLRGIVHFVHVAHYEKELNQLNEKLVKKISAIIFNLKTKNYESLLTSPDTTLTNIQPGANILEFFLSLQNLLISEENLDQSVSMTVACASFMKKLLSVFLSYNKCNLHCLKVMSLFFAVSGLDIPILNKARTCCSFLFKKKLATMDINVIALHHLLETCSTFSHYFTSMVVPEKYIKPSTWLKCVSTALLEMKISKNKSSWLKCFQSLLLITPTILEIDILPLIKEALLNISVHSSESKKEYCELYCIVLETHSQLHQVPKFFVKLLRALTECVKEKSCGKLLANGQILPQVQESIAKCVKELPHGQMTELWSVFNETFFTLEMMSNVLNVNKGFIFFVAQVFSTFLIHAQLFQANIPSNVRSRFSGLIESTSEEIKKNICALNYTKSEMAPFQRSLLLLSYAVGEIKLAYIAYYEKPPDKSIASVSQNPFDFSNLHNFLNSDNASILKSYLKEEDKILSVLVFQLLMQKIRALQFKELSAEVEKNHMAKLISTVLEHLQISSVAVGYWDSDMCTINDKNYGTACWKIFLKTSPLILNHLHHKDFSTLCYCVQNILQNDSSDPEAKGIIFSSLRNEFFQESKNFQTAFVSALWVSGNFLHKKRSYDEIDDQSSVECIFNLLNNYSSKSVKFAQLTPKSSENSGNLWNEIQEIADLLNTILLSESFPKRKLKTNKILDIIKLLTILPLEYLLPGNQVKCIIGLSVIFFLLPQNCKSTEAAQLAKEISLVLMSVFETQRSIWLFDFVNCGSYLKYMINTLNCVISVNSSNDSDWIVQLIQHLISLAVMRTKTLNALEQFISVLINVKNHTRITLVTSYALLRKLSQLLQRSYIPEKLKETEVRVSTLSCKTFVEYMKSNFNKESIISDHSLFIKCYIHVIEIACCSSSKDQENIIKECFELIPSVYQTAVEEVTNLKNDMLSDVYMLFISKVCKYNVQLVSFLPEDYVSVSWDIMLTHFRQKANRENKSISANENVKVASDTLSDVKSCSHCILSASEELNKENKNETKSVEDNKISSSWTLNEFELESLQELSVISSVEILSDVFQNILREMGCPGDTSTRMDKEPSSQMCLTVIESAIDKNNCQLSAVNQTKLQLQKCYFNGAVIKVPSFQIFLCVLKSLIDAINDKCQDPVLNQHLQKCLLHLYYTTNQVCGSSLCQDMFTLPILDFISFILKGNKGLPKSALLQSLHSIVNVPLEVNNENYKLFVQTFNAVWNIVYSLLMHHTSITISSSAAFSAYVAKLLKSLVKAGDAEPLSRSDTNTLQQMQLCAQNMNRLLTVLARHQNLSKLVPYLIADYVDTVQHVTLESNIKDALLSGIYRLLNLCSDHSIKMLAVNINYTCREIFENLVKNFRQNKYIGAE